MGHDENHGVFQADRAVIGFQDLGAGMALLQDRRGVGRQGDGGRLRDGFALGRALTLGPAVRCGVAPGGIAGHAELRARLDKAEIDFKGLL